MSTIKNLKWRYATKKFDSTKLLSNQQVKTLKEAFNLTATSYGLQPIKLAVINNKELQKQLVAHSSNQKQIGDASHLLVICVETNFTVDHVEEYFDLVKEKRKTPDTILNPFKNFLLDYLSKKNPKELFEWAKNQAYLALGNLLTVCAVEQIDSCPMEGFDPEKYDQILGLKEYGVSSVLVLPVGFRAPDDFMKDLAKVRKKSSKMIIDIL